MGIPFQSSSVESNITIDATVTENSTNAVSSDAVYDALQNVNVSLPTTASFDTLDVNNVFNFAQGAISLLKIQNVMPSFVAMGQLQFLANFISWPIQVARIVLSTSMFRVSSQSHRFENLAANGGQLNGLPMMELNANDATFSTTNGITASKIQSDTANNSLEIVAANSGNNSTMTYGASTHVFKNIVNMNQPSPGAAFLQLQSSGATFNVPLTAQYLLTVGGNATFNSNATVNSGLTVNGNATFNSALSASAINTNGAIQCTAALTNNGEYFLHYNGTPSDGQTVTYNASTTRWEVSTPSSGIPASLLSRLNRLELNQIAAFRRSQVKNGAYNFSSTELAMINTHQAGPGTEYAIEFFFQLTATNIFPYNFVNSNGLTFSILVENGNNIIRFMFYDGGNNYFAHFIIPTLQSNQWYHLYFVKTGTAFQTNYSNIQVYLDGTTCVCDPASTGTLLSNVGSQNNLNAFSNNTSGIFQWSSVSAISGKTAGLRLYNSDYPASTDLNTNINYA